MEPVILSESTTNLIDAVKIILFWVLSKLATPYRRNSLKVDSESFKILTSIKLGFVAIVVVMAVQKEVTS